MRARQFLLDSFPDSQVRTSFGHGDFAPWNVLRMPDDTRMSSTGSTHAVIGLC